MNIKYTIAGLFYALSLPAAAMISLDTSLSYGEVSGFSQTPRGGTPGTSSIERPSFSEVGIKHDTSHQFGAGIDYEQFNFYGQYHYLSLSDSRRLRSTLTTHAQTIPAAMPFEADFKYHWYTLGANYTYPLGYFLFVPSFDLNYLHYRYSFSSTASSSRSFGSMTSRVGLSILLPVSSELTATAQAATSVPVGHLRMTEANLYLHWHAYQGTINIIPYAGMGWLRIDFEDSQPLPNHYRYTMRAPNFTLGLKVAF